MSKNKRIRMRLHSYDYRVLGSAVNQIVETAKGCGARVCGPIPLPRKMKKVTVHRSPHIDSKARDQLERCTFGRFLEIDCVEGTLQALVGLNLSCGVKVEISYI